MDYQNEYIYPQVFVSHTIQVQGTFYYGYPTHSHYGFIPQSARVAIPILILVYESLSGKPLYRQKHLMAEACLTNCPD